MKTTKKKNPTDATMRNVRAAKKRADAVDQHWRLVNENVCNLMDAVKAAEGAISYLRADVINALARLSKLEASLFVTPARKVRR